MNSTQFDNKTCSSSACSWLSIPPSSEARANKTARLDNWSDLPTPQHGTWLSHSKDRMQGGWSCCPSATAPFIVVLPRWAASSPLGRRQVTGFRVLGVIATKRGRYTQRWLPSLYIATERNGTDGDGSTKVDVTGIGNALGKGWRCDQYRSRKAHQLKRIYTKYVIRTR
jgi:hypothetical protein